MPKLPKNNLLLISCLILLIIIAGSFLAYLAFNRKPVSTNQVGNQAGNVVVEVSGKKIYEADYEQHERVLNGPKRYLQLVDKTIKLSSKQEVIDDLVSVTKMEIGSKKAGIYPTDAEVKAAQDADLKLHPDLKATYPRYGWNDSDYLRNIFIKVLKDKVNNSILTWREAEYLTVRWDVIHIVSDQITIYKTAATTLLKKYQVRFSGGENVDNLLVDIQKDSDLVKTFLVTNAAQDFKLSNDKAIRALQRNTIENSKEVTSQHILGLKIGTKDDSWCNQDACYLTRIVSGNDGKYKTIDDWLKTI